MTEFMTHQNDTPWYRKQHPTTADAYRELFTSDPVAYLDGMNLVFKDSVGFEVTPNETARLDHDTVFTAGAVAARELLMAVKGSA